MYENVEMEDMDTSDTPWLWYYLADCGRWHSLEEDPHNPLQSAYIENYYQKNSKAVITLSSSHCKIDFSAMLQTDLETGKQRRIDRGLHTGRSCSCFTVPPVFWGNSDPRCPYQVKTFAKNLSIELQAASLTLGSSLVQTIGYEKTYTKLELIPLSELSAEYKTVEGYVKKDGLLDRPIVSINRIQNLDLWDIYCLKKKQIMRLQGVKEIQERRLFHGTQFSNIESICKYNFDLRIAGKHGSVYGKGIYFAKYATYADRYSKPSRDPLPLHGRQTRGVHDERTKILFLARVMVGESNVGQRDFIKPDDGCPENSHYSCVDDIKTPTVFVIFDPNQIYPEYLIQYR